MLPNGFTKKHLKKQLKIYNGDQHPHTPQSLHQITIKNNNNNKTKRIALCHYYEKKNTLDSVL